ncbi:hypothetical protein HPP92_024015 [Vanilla planifolia]|uniref:Protein kinase domain-containing protein n=1 Tax=Vanilla planifolia TaxID=51239 RepID=A0A835PL76_VANPL|nr:hypothetical protein HPP92_024015 [Vanilla planifolia]
MEGRMLSKGILLLWFNFLSMGFAEPEADKEALLDFLAGVTHGRALNWRDNTSVCKEWSGVVCDPDGSHVVELRLPGRGFNGQVPSNTLSRLSGLRILSLRSNRLSGTLPPDFSNLTALTGLHLQFNGFSGRLPSDFSAWKNLTMLDLSHNAFEGSIPGSISNLTHLASLNLSNNSLSGRIPELLPPNLQFLNLSSNHLEGSIPKSLLRFPHSSFSSNQLSPVFPQIHSPSPPPISHPFKRNVTESSLLGIIVGGSALAFVAFAVLLLLCFSSKKYGISSPREEKGHDSSEKRDAVNEEEHNRLVFFQGCSSAFDLEDLLRASAEVLGKGSYGTSYKAVLEDATTVVVKRLKEVSVGRREFEQQMEMLGNIRHDNVVGLKAYYFSKDEKLLVYDYYSKGSVYSMLHGKRDEARAELDWETRLQIAIGAATAIAHIHSEQGGKLVHGNIKSSNVFLNHRNHGCLSDLGLATMATPAAPRVPGYRAPRPSTP